MRTSHKFDDAVLAKFWCQHDPSGLVRWIKFAPHSELDASDPPGYQQVTSSSSALGHHTSDMEQWVPPNYENSVSLIRADGSEFWTALSPQRRARSPSRLTTFSDANGLVYLDPLPEPIMKDPSPKKRDLLADMLPSDWEPREKREPEPVKETPRESENENQPPANAQTQNKTLPSADGLSVDMPWNSVSSRTKRTKIRQPQAKSKAKPASKDAASVSPTEHDKSTDYRSPNDGSALRRSPRISKLIAHQKLQTTTPPSSRSEVKDSQNSKSGSVPAIPRKRKPQPQESKIAETSGPGAHNEKTTELPVKPSKIQRTEQASPVEANATADENEASRPNLANREARIPAEPEEKDSPHQNKAQKSQQARNKLQTPSEKEGSVFLHRHRTKKDEPASVQPSSGLEETSLSTYERPQKMETRPMYRDQATQAFGSQTTSQDAFLTKTIVNMTTGTQHRQRLSPKQAALASEAGNQHPKPFSQDSVPLPPPKAIVPSHIAHAWDRLAQRGSQHHTLDLKPLQEAVPKFDSVHHGEVHHGVDHEHSSSPLFMDQGPEYFDDQLPGDAPWPPKNVFRKGLGACDQVSHHDTATTLRKDPSHNLLPVLACAQDPDLAYSLPNASHLANELGGMPIQRSQSQGGASTSSEKSRETIPEEVWRTETADDSTFAIVHKIGMMLHRALKPREEVVDDIVKDYVKNSMVLLDQMSICHEAERETTVDNHEAATETLHSLFKTAWHDVRDLQEQLQSFAISQILATTRKPAFGEKMQTLNRLCDERLSKYIEQASRTTSEGEDRVTKRGDLVELFKSQLCEQIGHSDASSSKLRMIDAKADMFIERLRNDEVCFPSRQSGTQHVKGDSKTNLPGMEQVPGVPVALKQKKSAPVGEVLAGSSQEPIEISSHCDSDSDYID